MIRLGLCCQFRQAPIHFKRTTAKALKKLDRIEQLNRLDRLCLKNAHSLVTAVEEVHRLGIGAFRVCSNLLPLYTHPEVGYSIEELPNGEEIYTKLTSVKKIKDRYNLRLSFHPDQFTLLSSPRPEVTSASIKDLEYQAMLASLIGADAINIHGGGAYGDKRSALARLAEQVSLLPKAVRSRLTLENDDHTYTVQDLFPICEQLSIPLVYDVHHHRCNPDDLSLAEATEACLQTWQQHKREPLFHISSPKHGWNKKPKPHADYIDIDDFPTEWKQLDATIDVEAKAKELAVVKLQQELGLPPWQAVY
ncbi:cyclobutane pyrimidine dimer 5'-endonuclease, putative [Syntrophotalea carbinolica DSM 2380]|uniref:Cyclobutane pyrimidine dimer 5'-endonuclease, putative n=1 Tax=Syntrophotalea carbinolica (strain DSM 2380 / NBRC 103641 / GraBd1) TaxID=338963 RepID=Q3A4W2_SYNC1|nr:UV DNA damage repair endonuclease UvsE [Syntrophotalea carbinolica]ABA88595.1 cyclobutane pyrimidine dimer 5'-endonuclease, putative [Syntrophotalea carbinolica DSM 2380]